MTRVGLAPIAPESISGDKAPPLEMEVVLLDGNVCIESLGTVVRVPVKVVRGSVRRAEVRGLDAVSLHRVAKVTLLLEDDLGTIEVPAVIDWLGPTSGLRLLCPRAHHLTRLMRLMRTHFDASREVPTQPERPSALRRTTGRARD